jgi:hypothetical protein
LAITVVATFKRQDPTSPATESSHSNTIALRRTVNQIYGEAAALEVNDSLGSASGATIANEHVG